MEDGEKVRSYRDLNVWQQAMTLVEDCYRLTKHFPKEETYGMSAQIRGAAVSIAANIAEGQGREQTLVFVQFLRIAQGSLKELETHLMIAERVGLAVAEAIDPLMRRADDIGRMLRSLIRSLQDKAKS
jgi:four helix bundle protein